MALQSGPTAPYPHSFRSAPIDSSILSMAAELETLGGSSSGATSRFVPSATCVACSFPLPSLSPSTSVLSVSSPAPGASGPSYVTLSPASSSASSCRVSHFASSPSSLMSSLTPDVAEWSRDGFSSLVLSYGGSSPSASSSSASPPDGEAGQQRLRLASSLLLCESVGVALLSRPQPPSLYLSAWEVSSLDGEAVGDVLRDSLKQAGVRTASLPPSSSGAGGAKTARDLRFVSALVPNAAALSAVLSTLPHHQASLTSPSHLFLRLSLVFPPSSSNAPGATIHFVDIAPLAGANAPAAPGVRHSLHSLQLHALGSVVEGLSKVGPAADASSDQFSRPSASSAAQPSSSSSSRLHAAARSTKLSQFVSPLLLSGSRVWFVGHLSPSPRDASATRETMRLLSDFERIPSACLSSRLGKKGEGGEKARSSPPDGAVSGDDSAKLTRWAMDKARAKVRESVDRDNLPKGVTQRRPQSAADSSAQLYGSGDDDDDDDGAMSDDSIEEMQLAADSSSPGDHSGWLAGFKLRRDQAKAPKRASDKKSSWTGSSQVEVAASSGAVSATTTTMKIAAAATATVHDDEQPTRRRSYALTGGAAAALQTKDGKAEPRRSQLIVGRGAGFSPDGRTSPSVKGRSGKDSVLKSGWLWKKGSVRRNWKRRFFELGETTLDYYKAAEGGERIGFLDLRGAAVATVQNGDSFAFDITLPKENGIETRHFKTENEVDRIHWILNIEQCFGGKVGERERLVTHWSEEEEEEEEEAEGVQGKQGGGGSPQAAAATGVVGRHAPSPVRRASLEHLSSGHHLDDIDDYEGETNDHENEHEEKEEEEEEEKELGEDTDGAPPVPTLEHLASSDDYVPGGSRLLSHPDDDTSGGSDDGGKATPASWHSSEGSRASSRKLLVNKGGRGREQVGGVSLEVAARDLPSKVLYSNYDTLLSLLREERKVREKMTEKNNNLEHTLIETATSYQLEVEDLKKSNLEYKQKFRKLTNESAYKELFEQFEEEIEKLRKEGEMVRDRNVKLELALFEKSRVVRGGAELQQQQQQQGKDGKSLVQPPMHFQDGLHKQLVRRLKEIEKENANLREANGILRNESRLLAVSKSQKEQSQNCMLKLGTELDAVKKNSHSLHQSKSHLERHLYQAEAEAAHWRQAEARAATEIERLKLELQLVGSQAVKFRQQAKANNLVQKFLEKHAPTYEKSQAAQKLMDDEKSGNGSNADEMEAAIRTLDTAVKKALPTLSPAVAKVAGHIQKEMGLARERERQLMMNMVELLRENGENIDTFLDKKRAYQTSVVGRVLNSR